MRKKKRNDMKDTAILVTGGNGFIGAKIVEKLVLLGYTPLLLLRKNSNRERLLPVLNKIRIFEASLEDAKDVSGILKKANPDIIIHLAGHGVYSYEDMSAENIRWMVDSNINGTANLLYAALKTHCKMFVNTGSCFEYGSNNVPFDEDSMLNPVNMYGVTKAAATLFSQVFSRTSPFSLITVRPFTAYGQGQDQRRFISTAIRQCLQGKDLALTKQKIVRDYIYIEDVVDGYLAVIEYGEKLTGEIINISTGKGTLLEDVAKIIIQKTNANVKIDIGSFPIRNGEVLSLVGRAEKAERLLKWKAKYSLEDGISKTIKWEKQISNQ